MILSASTRATGFAAPVAVKDSVLIEVQTTVRAPVRGSRPHVELRIAGGADKHRTGGIAPVARHNLFVRHQDAAVHLLGQHQYIGGTTDAIAGRALC